jgi:hypothetical protein
VIVVYRLTWPAFKQPSTQGGNHAKNHYKTFLAVVCLRLSGRISRLPRCAKPAGGKPGRNCHRRTHPERQPDPAANRDAIS